MKHAPLAVLLLLPLAPAQEPLLVVPGRLEGEAFGSALASPGDTNDDGVPDLLVGAPGQSRARLVSGSNGQTLEEFVGDGNFGQSVAALPDLDGDGTTDLAVGSAEGFFLQFDYVRVFSGASGSKLLDLRGKNVVGPAYGWSIAPVGDLTGDGLVEIAVGAPTGPEPGLPAYVLIHSGANGAPVAEIPGGGQFGWSLASGLLDRDGALDLVVGSNETQSVSTFNGADLVPLFTSESDGHYGRAVAVVGDLDGDGSEDVAVGAPLARRVDVLSGADGSLLRRFEIDVSDFGAAVAAVGDMDEDGVPDIAVGAPSAAHHEIAKAGRAYVMSGSTGQVLLQLRGDILGQALGRAVAGPGDLDGDGRPELAVGAAFDDAGSDAGSVRIYPGALAGKLLAFGFSCPNAFLIPPRLTVFGDPAPGGTLELEVTQGTGDSPAIQFFGLAPGETGMKGGCIFWISGLLPVATPFTLSSGGPGEGTALLTGQLPIDLPSGLSFTTQTFILDPIAEQGFTNTNGVRVEIL